MPIEQPTSTDKLADSSVAALVERLSAQVSELVRDEIALATAEIKQRGSRVGTGIGISGAGGLLAMYGLAALFAAAVVGLATVLAAWLAALIVGVVLLALAGVLAVTGIGRMRTGIPPVPERAVQSTKQDIETVKRSMHR